MPIRVRSQESMNYAKMSMYSWEISPLLYPRSGTYRSIVKNLGTSQTVIDQQKRKPWHILKRQRGHRVTLKPIRNLRKALELNEFTARKARGYCTPSQGKISFYNPDWNYYHELDGFMAAIGEDCLYYQGNNLFTTTTTNLTWDQSKAEMALAKAYSKFTQPEADVAMALMEIGETLTTINGLVKTLTLGAGKVLSWFWSNAVMVKSSGWTVTASRKMRFVSGRTGNTINKKSLTKSAIDKAANRWLELRFGILPTISDVEETSEVLETQIADLERIRCARSTISEPVETITGTTQMNVNNFWIVLKYSGTVRRKTTAGIYYKYKYKSSANDLDNRTGFRLNRLPALAWERIPFSFVVDWFFGVGQWLDALAPDPSRIYLGNFVSQKLEYEITQTVVSVSSMTTQPYRYLSSPDQRYYFKYREIKRRVNQDLPEFPVQTGKWKSLMHLSESIALLWQIKLKHLL